MVKSNDVRNDSEKLISQSNGNSSKNIDISGALFSLRRHCITKVNVEGTSDVNVHYYHALLLSMMVNHTSTSSSFSHHKLKSNVIS